MTMPLKVPPNAAAGSPSRLQRTSGSGRLSVKHALGATRIDRLFEEGAARIRLPRVTPGHPLEAVMINTAGGLTGGDRMDYAIEAGRGTSLTVTTQACEKTYKSVECTAAEISSRLVLHPGASLAWLPQETILFDRAILKRRLDVDMSASSRLLLVEPVVYGRLAMGENVRSGLFADRWRVRMDGRLIHAEDFSIGPDMTDALGARTVLNGMTASATMLLVDPDAHDRLAAVRRMIGNAGGASAWRLGDHTSGRLLARIMAKDSYDLRKILLPLIGLLNPLAGLPKVWSL